MPVASNGVEFFLIEITPENELADPTEVENMVASALRGGDVTFNWGGRLFAAVAGPMPDASSATKRITSLLQARGIKTSVRALSESLPADVVEDPEVLGRVGMKLYARPDSGGT